jgi:TonB family protein
MIAAAMVHLLVVSLLAALAAWCADSGLRRLSVPTRGIWLLALAAAPLSLLTSTLLPARAARPLPVAPLIELPGLVAAGAGGLGVDLDFMLGAVWLALSLSLVGLLARTHVGLLRERRHWASAEVLGRPVYLSADRGPAIAGLWRPGIVLPRWVLALPEAELGLVVLHEEEHMRARDTATLATALTLVALTPWNPLTWWQLGRLRGAVEVDCDRRVLRREPDRGRYGRSLLAVAARAPEPMLGVAAFSERSHSLERRILTMTSTRSRWTPLTAGLLMVVALLLGVQACNVESPTEEVAPAVVELPAPSILARPELREGPTFTPFTVAPSILNRNEIVSAMGAEYPPLLREAGIGGSVIVYMFVNEFGKLEEVRLQESSGHRALDEAALRVAELYEFSPARNREEPVPVWVQFPITFQVRAGEGEGPR